MKKPQAASRLVELTPGVSALAPGLLWMHDSRTLVAADVHFGYENAIGAALPAWSTAETASTILVAIEEMRARETILLGDVVHSSRLSEGASARVRSALESLRDAAELTIVAGNHEGKTRGAAILGETVETAERDGWLLLHGDKPADPFELARLRGAIIGHLHPSLPLGARATAPAFVAGPRIIAVPAMTPYSSGLNVTSRACLKALTMFGEANPSELHVVAATAELCYPFGALSELPKILSSTK